MNDFAAKIRQFVFFMALAIGAIGIFIGVHSASKDSDNKIFEEGKADREQGVSSAGNPYAGLNANNAKAWLEGWKQGKDYENP
jgi:hypothetical protein